MHGIGTRVAAAIIAIRQVCGGTAGPGAMHVRAADVHMREMGERGNLENEIEMPHCPM